MTDSESRFEPRNLAFLAPALRCNQSCPRCAITEVFGEPVQPSVLRPEHYGRFVSDLTAIGVPIRSVSFLGYEVTLPESWPYLEVAFSVAKRHRLRRAFITNGMLLHKWTERITALDPNQITVSLDGASPEINDALRGLPGAFDATLGSLDRFLLGAPRFRERVVVASTLFSEANAHSLRAMPWILARIGATRWVLGAGLSRDGTRVDHLPTATLRPWLVDLAAIAAEAGVSAHFVDLGHTGLEGIPGLSVESPGGLDDVLRLDPNGTIRSGAALMRPYDTQTARRWDPARKHAAVAAGLVSTADPGAMPMRVATVA